MVAARIVDASLNLRGHWLDSTGYSIVVSDGLDESLTAVLTPLHPEAKGRILRLSTLRAS